MRSGCRTVFLAAVASSTLCFSMPASAQDAPWDVFADAQSTSVCDVVNAENSELVVLTDTGQLVIITGADLLLEDSFVDFDGTVFFEGAPAGFIDFAEDGDGFRTLWWTSLTGRVVSVDGFTGEPSESTLFPDDFSNVPCDACLLWDDPTVCDDPGNGGGGIDIGPGTTPPISISFCGVGTQLSLAMTMLGLMLTSYFARNRA